MPLLANDLRCEVLRRPTDRESLIVPKDITAGKTEISELNKAILANEDVFRLKAALETHLLSVDNVT